MNDQWRLLYVNFFSSIEAIIEAYNSSQDEHTIEILHKNQVPKNIFDATPENFYYIIKFTGSLYWRINMLNMEVTDDDIIPHITIYVVDQFPDTGVLNTLPDLRLMLHSSFQKIVITNKWYNFSSLEFTPIDKLDNLEEDIKRLAKEVFEFQLIRLD